VTGGKRFDRPGNFIQPTVFTDCTHEMKIVQEEIFGPVLSVMKFSDVDEVIAKANDTKYGLVGAVFSESQKTCNKVARELQIGKISINNYFMIGVDSPFGGFKQSGIGREMGRGVENYLEAKTIIYDCS